MQGFTLVIERLVAVCIVSILSCMAFTHYYGAIDRARSARQLLDQRTYATQQYVESDELKTKPHVPYQPEITAVAPAKTDMQMVPAAAYVKPASPNGIRGVESVLPERLP